MDGRRMTTHTVKSAGECDVIVIWGAGMARPIVTILAQLGDSLGQQPFMGAAVHRMANLTILFRRGVGKYRWTAFIRMTFETQFPRIVGIDHMFTHAAVWRMAGRTFNFPLD
jgi:hypothetical protein